MNPVKKHGTEKDLPGGEKKSTAETQLKPPQSDAPSRQSQEITPRAPPGTAGTPITVTPYKTSGNATFFQVGSVLCGSEEDALMTLKNMLFKPSIPPA